MPTISRQSPQCADCAESVALIAAPCSTADHFAIPVWLKAADCFELIPGSFAPFAQIASRWSDRDGRVVAPDCYEAKVENRSLSDSMTCVRAKGRPSRLGVGIRRVVVVTRNDKHKPGMIQ